MQSAAKAISAEAFQRLAGEPGYRLELVRGMIVRSPGPGLRHGQIEANVVLALGDFIRRHGLGALLCGGASYVLGRRPDTVRGPDVSFISDERMRRDRLPDSYLDGSPDLAIEILSPSNRASEMQEKIADLFRGGCREVWLLDPKVEEVRVFRDADSARTLGAGAQLTTDLLPGFRCHAGDFFRAG